MDNLTDSQRNLLKAIRREMVEVTQPVLDEVAKLRDEQRARHEAGKKQEHDNLKRAVIRFAKGLLAVVGRDEE